MGKKKYMWKSQAKVKDWVLPYKPPGGLGHCQPNKIEYST